MDKVYHSATCTRPRPCQSACNTCKEFWEEKKKEEGLSKYHLPSEVWGNSVLNDEPIYSHTVKIVNASTFEMISSIFLYVCALIALSFNRVIDFVLEGFEKAYRGKRL